MHLGINKQFLLVQLLFISCVVYSQPNAKIIAPSQARIGLSTTVNVQILSKNITGPARITINVPDNWDLEKYPGEIATVSQSNNQVRAIWLEFPRKDTVDVVFMLQLPTTNEKGNFMLSGWMDYMENGNPKRVEINQHTFKVVKYYTRIQ